MLNCKKLNFSKNRVYKTKMLGFFGNPCKIFDLFLETYVFEHFKNYGAK